MNSEIDFREAFLAPPGDLVCLSHLRWDFVFQRPQHLLTRCARERRVFFVEEPVLHDGDDARLSIEEKEGGVRVVVPHLPENLDETSRNDLLAKQIDRLLLD